MHALCIRINSEFPLGPSCTPPSRFAAATQIRTRVRARIVYCFCFFFFSFTVSKATVSHPNLIFPVDRHDHRHGLANTCTKRFIYGSPAPANAGRSSGKTRKTDFQLFRRVSGQTQKDIGREIERNLVRTRMYIGRQRFSAVGGFLNFSQLNGTPEVLRRDKSSGNIRGAREKQRSFLKRAKCTRKRVRGDGSGRCRCRSD